MSNAMHSFVKSYSDKNYKYPVMVSHKGSVIGFAMDENAQIWYSVLDLNQGDDDRGHLDVNYWPDDPSPLLFTNEIAQSGYSIAGNTQMPVVKQGGKVEDVSGLLNPDEIDAFLSSTARLTADAPFHVVSDNKYVYVFRQSVGRDDDRAVFKLKSSGTSGNESHPERVEDKDNTAVPVVNNTLLCDRFVLSGSHILAKQEVRYKRSGHKTRPASNKDSLGANDMSGKPFIEPTQELDFINGLSHGRFCVLRLPTQVSDSHRWHFFAYNEDTKKIDSVNMAQAEDGLFDSKGETQNHTIAPMQRNSFRFTDLELASGLSAALYHQQEKDAEGQPLRSAARVMLSAATCTPGEDNAYLATLDFGLSRKGLLTLVPDEIPLPEIDNSQSKVLEEISAKEAQAQAIRETINRYENSGGDAAMVFNGKNTFIEIDAHEKLNSKQYTAEFWMYPQLDTYEETYTDIVYSPFIGYLPTTKTETKTRAGYGVMSRKQRLHHFCFHSNKNFYHAFKTANNSNEYIESNGSPFEFDKWQHVAITNDGKRVTMHINGSLVKSGNYYSELVVDNDPIYIGMEDNRGNLFKGMLDDIRIWDHVRSAEQIRTNMNRRLNDQQNGLVGYWSMKEGKLFDFSGNNFHGKVSGELETGPSPIAGSLMDTSQLKDELATLQAEINALKSNKLNGLSRSLDYLYMDPQGLTLSGALLKFAHAKETPHLLDSATGKLALYFRGSNEQFFAAYHDTTVSRHVRTAELEDGSKMILRATMAGEEMNEYWVSVSTGIKPELCTVTVRHPDDSMPDEAWRHVPRNAQAFAEVFNGRAKDYRYELEVAVSFEGYSAKNGSLCFNVNPGQSNAFVKNGTMKVVSDGSSSRWVADAPGQALVFDGKDDHVSLQKEQLPQMALNSSLTMEAWVNPNASLESAYVVSQKDAELHYGLGLSYENQGSGSSEHFAVFAEVGNRVVRSVDSFPAKKWSHIAAVFDQSYALSFKRNGYLLASNADALNLGGAMTLEAFVQVADFGGTQTLVSKGSLSAASPVPYVLQVDGEGKLTFAFQDQHNKTYQVSTHNHAIKAGQFHRIAVTRHENFANPVEGLLGAGSTSINVADLENLNISIPGSGGVETTFTVNIYVDGVKQGIQEFRDLKIGSNEEDVSIGGDVTDSSRGLSGALSEVRLWSRVLTMVELHQKVNHQNKGLVAHWMLEENQGNLAEDSAGGYHAKINAARWIRNPDPKGSALRLYNNGVPLAAEEFVGQGLGDNTADTQFTLGGYLSAETPTLCFNGVLEEVRVWKTARTQEQLLDNLFTRLKGEKQHLLANYCFDDKEASGEVLDSGLRGNHLQQNNQERRPVATLSTAPVSNDTAQVRSALAGVKSAFHTTIESAPAVQEYADLQYDSDNNLQGVMKRCYSYIEQGQWKLNTGYKVGNLITEWVGQAQFDPQIMGYMEGTPPVPSENMTYGTNGTGTGIYEGDGSSIELVQATEVNYNYSASKEHGFDASFENSLTNGIEGEIAKMIAPLGFGVSIPLKYSILTGRKSSLQSSGNWVEEKTSTKGSVQTRSLYATLGGNWEDPDNMLNPEIGRRWMSASMGFAVVQSETADVFALRLEHNKALVSFRFQPNPDIPKDWNIVSFPINPKYIKQGTLDGKVGYNPQGQVVCDPDYPNATGYGENSYFKPKKAYALKRKIEREEQELASYYRNYGAAPLTKGPLGGAIKQSDALHNALSGLLPGATIGRSAAAVFGSMAEASRSSAAQDDLGITSSFSKRNIANTYIWTADGGMFKETNETIDVVQETAGGNYSFTGTASNNLGFNGNVASISFGVELDASLSGSMSLTQEKSKESSKSFSIDAHVTSSGDMQRHDPHSGDPIYKDGLPDTVAGRVDAYRWMTFYQQSSRQNFEELFDGVVDPVWLEQSDHPNALALRQAKQDDKAPPCWRVNHIVTFVSRILPEFVDDNEIPMAKAMKKENVNSNWQLIQKLEPFVKNKTADAVTFAGAVRQAIQQYLPEMQPHADEVIDYLGDYYGVTGLS